MSNRRLGVQHLRPRHLLALLSVVVVAGCGDSAGSSADPADDTVVDESAPERPRSPALRSAVS
jgi:hypothetical protein